MNSLTPATHDSLSVAQFDRLTDVPAELEWLANITNEKRRRAYKCDVTEFSQYVGLRKPEEFRTVTRAHVIAWRETSEVRALSAPTIRRKLAALSSLYAYLCERNAVAGNPVDGVKRPSVARIKWTQRPLTSMFKPVACSRRSRGDKAPFALEASSPTNIILDFRYHGGSRPIDPKPGEQ